jgi:hypothetical protein
MPRHIIAKDECENILGVVPLYLKRFSICYFVNIASSFIMIIIIIIIFFFYDGKPLQGRVTSCPFPVGKT